MFFKLGISPINSSERSRPFNLFQLKTSITAYINDVLFIRKIALFPKVAELFNLCNNFQGPKLCAVDDLGFFDSYNVQELIEFQSSKNASTLGFDASLGVFPIEESLPSHRPQPSAKFQQGNALDANSRVSAPQHDQRQARSQGQYQPYNNRHLQFDAHSLNTQPQQHAHQHSHHHPHQHSLPHVAAPLQANNVAGGSTAQENVSYDMAIPQNDNSMSHFNLNMIQLGADVVSDRYFDDFVHHRGNEFDLQSFYGSSSESYVSPLDDEFFKTVSPVSSFSNEDSGAINVKQDRAPELPVVQNNTADIVNQRKRKFDVSSPALKSSTTYYNVDPIDYLMSNVQGSVPDLSQKASTKKQSRSISAPKIKKEPEQNSIPSAEDCTNMESKKLKVELSSNEYKFKCNHCDATFKVKGYLTRHIKKHNSSMAFTCPFYQEIPSTVCSTSKKNVFSGTKCHPTGGFSRRDTFKTHLKALHFIYPPGTKQVERNSIGGRCAGCFQYFEDNHQWIVEHIEKGACEGSVNKHADF